MTNLNKEYFFSLLKEKGILTEENKASTEEVFKELSETINIKSFLESKVLPSIKSEKIKKLIKDDKDFLTDIKTEQELINKLNEDYGIELTLEEETELTNNKVLDEIIASNKLIIKTKLLNVIKEEAKNLTKEEDVINLLKEYNYSIAAKENEANKQTETKVEDKKETKVENKKENIKSKVDTENKINYSVKVKSNDEDKKNTDIFNQSGSNGKKIDSNNTEKSKMTFDELRDEFLKLI